MIITSMKVQNFLSIGKATFDFRDAGLTLIEGENLDDESAKSNGSGKSTIPDALIWCLFGTTLRGYENDEVVHRKVGEDCLVTVMLENGDEIYTVARARKHSKFKNTLRVIRDGGDEEQDMSGPSNAETQLIVEKLIGCSCRTFLSSVIFGQDRAYRFSSLTDKEQKEILDEVLGVERFAQACGAARAKVSTIESAASNIKRDLEKAEDAIETARVEAKEMRDKDASFEGERKGKLKVEREKLDKAKEWVKRNAGDNTDKLKLAFERAQKIMTTTEKEVANCNKEVTEAKVARAGIKARLDELRAGVKKHEVTGAALCPTCGQRVDNTQHKRVLGDLKKKLVGVTAVYEKADEVVSEFDSSLAEAQRKLIDVRREATSAQRTLNEAVAETANAVSWKRRAKDHEERISELEKETNPYAALAKKAEVRRDHHEAEVALLTTQLSAEEKRLRLAEFWVEAFGAKGLRSLLIDSSLPLLNDEAARISQAVTGGTIKVEFSATSELKSGKTVDRFEVRVDNKYGAATYRGNSAGERAKVDLCVGLALQRLVASRSSASFNIVFFDEAMDHLDSAAHELVINVLSEIEKDSVYVISHDEDLKSWFPSSLKIIKEGGFSRVE